MTATSEPAAVSIVTDLSEGDWIREALADWSTYSVGMIVPAGFDAYLLVRFNGSQRGFGPIGSAGLAVVSPALAQHTRAPQDCFHAIWDGYGWLNRGASALLVAEERTSLGERLRQVAFRRPGWGLYRRPWRRRRRSGWGDYLPPNTLPPDAIDAKRLHLPNRDYILMRGPLREALNLGQIFGDRVEPQSPNLLWPSDHAWILATDIDLDGTFIGGSTELAEAILSIDGVDARIVGRDDRIADLGIDAS